MNDQFDLAVVGSGVAAHAAATQAASLGMQVLHLAGSGLPGGLVANVGALEDYPAAPVPVSGAELVAALARQADEWAVKRVQGDALSIETTGHGFAIASGSSRWMADQVIAATGASLRTLDVPGASRFIDRGLLQCAWCNAGLYRGRQVVVIGGGDSALQEALHLAKHAHTVIVVVRGETLRARHSFATRAADHDNIEFRWEAEVLSLEGADALDAIVIKERFADAPERIVCDAVFSYTGLAPSSKWLGPLVDRDEHEAVTVDARLQTRTAGLYAVGALRSGFSGQLVVAIGEAALVAQIANKARH